MKVHNKKSTENEKTLATPLSITYRDIETLYAESKNPRLHSKRQIAQISRSIKTFGFSVPLLIDAQQRLIAGHGRLAACKLLGLRQVPTISLEHLTETQTRAFMIADNRLAEIASWDDRLLAEQLKILSEADLDFNLEVTGFEIGELDLMIEGLEPGDRENDAADALPEMESATPVTHPGDLWLLDRHRIICGDALDQGTYSRLLDDKRAAAVFTDPPYNDLVDGYVKASGKTHHPEFAMASGEMSPEEFTAFLSRVFRWLVHSTQQGALHYVCMDWRHCREILAAAERIYDDFKNLCVWVKDTGGMGSFYRGQHELVFVFKSGTTQHRNNVELGRYGRYRTNVWQYPRVTSPSGRKEEPGLSASHPTPKPVNMVADAILDCTARGDIVLDAFLGSGTTLIAAERIRRTACGIELEPRYVDLAIQRWQAFTGHSAIHAVSGKSFIQLEEVLHGR